MANTAATTLEELARMPEDGLRHEIDAGELLVVTRPNSRHGAIQANLIGILREYVRRGKLGRIYSESGFILSRHPEILRGPDVAFVRTDRLAEIPEDGWAELGPDLVVEIVSPSDTARQMDRKVHQYLAAGTRAIWLVYPETRSVHIFEPQGIARVVEFDGVAASPTALPGFELPVRDIFE
ncbi:MAG: Uma2 family endonuclease [Bryobacteraceae bacterium]